MRNPFQFLLLASGIVLGRARTQPMPALWIVAGAVWKALGVTALFLGRVLHALVVAAAEVWAAIRCPLVVDASIVVGVVLLAEAVLGATAGIFVALWLLAKLRWSGGGRASRAANASSRDRQVLAHMTELASPPAPPFDAAAFAAQISTHSDAELRRMASHMTADPQGGPSAARLRQDLIQQRQILYRTLDERRGQRHAEKAPRRPAAPVVRNPTATG